MLSSAVDCIYTSLYVMETLLSLMHVDDAIHVRSVILPYAFRYVHPSTAQLRLIECRADGLYAQVMLDARSHGADWQTVHVIRSCM